MKKRREETVVEEENRLRIVLKQLIENNDYLVENYRKWEMVAANSGLDVVSREIGEAGQFIRIATQKLKAALDIIES